MRKIYKICLSIIGIDLVTLTIMNFLPYTTQADIIENKIVTVINLIGWYGIPIGIISFIILFCSSVYFISKDYNRSDALICGLCSIVICSIIMLISRLANAGL